MVIVRQASTNCQSRAFLELFPTPQRSLVVNMFLAPVRRGVSTPPAVVIAVRQDAGRRTAQALQCGDQAQHAKMIALLEALQAYSDEAQALAAWAIGWEATPPDQRERIKRERGEGYRQRWMAEHPPTERQLRYLRELGYRGQVASRLDASQLIDTLLNAGRSEIREA
jgi:hypothetical protein